MPPKLVGCPPYDLWDFISGRGENLIARWADEEKLNKSARAKMDQRFDRLMQVDFELAIHTNLINGPVKKEIYKVKVNGDVQLRPLVCRGPIEKTSEYTILVGAIERNKKLEPSTCLTDASNNRDIILADNRRRCPHEKFG